MSCSTCLSFELPECPDTITFKTVLAPNTDFYLHIMRSKTLILKVTSNDDGNLVLQVKDNPKIAPAYFNRYGGFYEIRLTTQLEAANYEDIELCDGSKSDCLLVTFKKFDGEQPAAVIPGTCP